MLFLWRVTKFILRFQLPVLDYLNIEKEHLISYILYKSNNLTGFRDSGFHDNHSQTHHLDEVKWSLFQNVGSCSSNITFYEFDWVGEIWVLEKIGISFESVRIPLLIEMVSLMSFDRSVLPFLINMMKNWQFDSLKSRKAWCFVGNLFRGLKNRTFHAISMKDHSLQSKMMFSDQMWKCPMKSCRKSGLKCKNGIFGNGSKLLRA
jgi:hypothetical protein